ncbi:hypothetical protein ACFQZO_13135 [Bradyrhizobium sp. GCM10027634]|uniref:hypothetical protein n=1 Tax=unclassified Bradyrhizobium TaxID=2631580 RepID=UPI00188D59A7|nr:MULTISPECIES: hypothetical protein [unclassified Bradyrhizobium]MDN5001831.1 hypothetical protein [Bradyrhizobium sp. WYCCWR 12677]
MDFSPKCVAGGAAVVVVTLITISGFSRDAPKAQNGFVPDENCFVAGPATKQFPENINHFMPDAWRFEPAWKQASDLVEAARSHPRRQRFTCILRFSAEGQPTKTGPAREPRIARARPKPSKTEGPVINRA